MKSIMLAIYWMRPDWSLSCFAFLMNHMWTYRDDTTRRCPLQRNERLRVEQIALGSAEVIGEASTQSRNFRGELVVCHRAERRELSLYVLCERRMSNSPEALRWYLLISAIKEISFLPHFCHEAHCPFSQSSDSKRR